MKYQKISAVTDMLAVIPVYDVKEILVQSYGYSEQQALDSIAKARKTAVIISKLKKRNEVRIAMEHPKGRIALHLEDGNVYLSSGNTTLWGYALKVGTIDDVDAISIYADRDTEIIENPRNHENDI